MEDIARQIKKVELDIERVLRESSDLQSRFEILQVQIEDADNEIKDIQQKERDGIFTKEEAQLKIARLQEDKRLYSARVTQLGARVMQLGDEKTKLLDLQIQLLKERESLRKESSRRESGVFLFFRCYFLSLRILHQILSQNQEVFRMSQWALSTTKRSW